MHRKSLSTNIVSGLRGRILPERGIEGGAGEGHVVLRPDTVNVISCFLALNLVYYLGCSLPSVL